MNSETVFVHKKGDGFEIVVQHDESGSSYGLDLSQDDYNQLREHFNNNNECQHPFYAVHTRCSGEINKCLECGKDL